MKPFTLLQDLRRRPLLWYFLPLAAWAVAIAWASLAPPDRLPDVEASDKTLHGLVYAGLGLLLLRAWLRGAAPRSSAALGALAAAALFGFVMECLQHLTPTRTFDFYDELANTLGAAAGIAAGWAIIALWRHFASQPLLPQNSKLETRNQEHIKKNEFN